MTIGRQLVGSIKLLDAEAALAKRLDRDYLRLKIRKADPPHLVIVGVLEAAVPFVQSVADQLVLNHPKHADRVHVAWALVKSYSGTKQRRKPRAKDVKLLSWPALRYPWVVLLDTVLDSGATLAAVMEQLDGQGHHVDEVVCLVGKKDVVQKCAEISTFGYGGLVDVSVCFDLNTDAFLVGHGLDHNGLYRQLPAIHALRES